MHQTTIRFSQELWDRLEAVAEDGGVSVAQYVREAAIERLARTGALIDQGEITAGRIAHAATELELSREAARALEAQSRLARLRARKLREEAEAAREK
jgi:predicted DNA-binding ribbon-helix-helix protein